MNKTEVELMGITQKAKDRIRMHGARFRFVSHVEGDLHVESQDGRWAGWFTPGVEVDVIRWIRPDYGCRPHPLDHEYQPTYFIMTSGENPCRFCGWRGS